VPKVRTSPEITAGNVVVDDAAPVPSLALENKGMIEAVRTAVEALAPNFRAVIILREMDGLS